MLVLLLSLLSFCSEVEDAGVEEEALFVLDCAPSAFSPLSPFCFLVDEEEFSPSLAGSLYKG